MLRCEAEVRGKMAAIWLISLICLSVVFALLYSRSLYLALSLSPAFVYGNRCANYAMRNVIGKWLNWLNEAAIVTICHSPCRCTCHMPQLPLPLLASLALGQQLKTQ